MKQAGSPAPLPSGNTENKSKQFPGAEGPDVNPDNGYHDMSLLLRLQSLITRR